MYSRVQSKSHLQYVNEVFVHRLKFIICRVLIRDQYIISTLEMFELIILQLHFRTCFRSTYAIFLRKTCS